MKHLIILCIALLLFACNSQPVIHQNNETHSDDKPLRRPEAGKRVKVASTARTPKNIIVIFADDFGYGDMGCFRELYQGGDDRTLSHQFTPNLDKLGSEGIRFTQAYTTSWCAPARQNLLSGRWCNRADNLAQPWIGKQLRDLGYSTCFVGKSHGKNSTDKVMNTIPETAEYNNGFFFPGGARSFYLRPGEKFPSYIGFKEQPFVAQGGEYITDVFTDFGVEYIKRSVENENPFFLYMAYTASHSPLDGKLEDLQEMFPGEFDDLEEEDWREFLNASDQLGIRPKSAKDLKGVRKPMEGWAIKDSPSYKQMQKLGLEKYQQYNFAALVYRMDKGIGKLMKTLKDAGVDDETLVVFTSDNGSVLGSNYPLTGYKSSHFEGGVRVPMIFWSKSISESASKGRIVEEITPTTDIAPTLIGMVKDEKTPKFPFDGINLWPYVVKNKAIPDNQVFYYSSSNSMLYKNLGLNSPRQPEVGILKTLVKESGNEIFGQLGKSDRMFNAVYVKGKEKVVYWSSLDGVTRGAVYKALPSDGRSSRNPQTEFKEECVTEGAFPHSKEGKKLMKEFEAYVAKPGAGEIMSSPVFEGTDNSKQKRAREYVTTEQNKVEQ
mgnify:CR=1 FL=1